MATYATTDDFADYSDLTVVDTAALELQLERAERDIDRIIGYQGVRPAGQTLKLVPADLSADDRTKLKWATCAQAEYRETMGAKFFRTAQYQQVTGPRFSTSGTLPRIGPKVREELDGATFVRGRWATVYR